VSDDDLRFEHRMSDMDALMWAIEKDPLLRSTITAVSVLDQPPDRRRLQAKIERATRVIPRLRQRVVGNPLSIAPPRWEVDPHFDLEYHVRWMRSPGDGSIRDLLDVTEPVAMQGFDRARPLWEFVVVEGLEGGRSALIQKVHHAVTDGVGGVKMAMALLDLEREPAVADGPLPPAPDAAPLGPLARVADALAHERRRQLGIARRSLGTVTRGITAAAADPVTAAREAATTVASVGRLVAPATAPLSPLMRGRSRSVHFDTITVGLAEMKAAARQVEGKLNDAIVAAVIGGLRRYHQRHGVEVEALRMTMPISIRTDETATLAGTQFVPARFPVPVHIDDPVARMAALRDLVGEQRGEPALGLTEPLAQVLNRLPTSVTTAAFGSMLKGIDFVTSNVPGAPIPVYLAGAKLESQFPFGPLSGSALNVTLLSYCDDLHVGVNVDPAAVPDTDVLHACLVEGFDEVRKLA
jgi:WS/DGAT/MGAT family acyltransferase